MILDIYLDEKCLISIEKDSQSMTCTGKVLIKTLLKEKWTSIRHNSVDFITYIVQLAEVCRMRGRQIAQVVLKQNI